MPIPVCINVFWWVLDYAHRGGRIPLHSLVVLFLAKTIETRQIPSIMIHILEDNVLFRFAEKTWAYC